MGWVWWWWLACVPPWPGNTLVVDPTLGFVYPASLASPSPTTAHHAGMRYAQKNLEDLPGGYRPEVPPYDADEAFAELMEEGANVVFTTRYDFASATQQAAANHPQNLFFNCGGRVTGPNLASYGGRMYQAMYLAGRLGASASCTGRLGVVATLPTPEVIRNINAFTLGARKVDPLAVVEVRFVGSWADPRGEEEAVSVMVGRGADVIAHQTDGVGTLEAIEGLTVECGATTAPVRAIAYGAEGQCADYADTCLTTVWWNWGPLYVDLLTQVLDGTLDTRKIRYEGFDRDHSRSVLQVSAPGEGVDDAVWQGALSEWDELASNDAAPFTGPLADNEGVPRLEEGESISDDALEEMCWFVEGVTNGFNGTDPAEVPDGCIGEY
jgi:basic membrane protein A